MTLNYFKIMRLLTIGLISAISLLSLNSAASERWYNQTLVENGNYPPPPLNGSGHAWHHSIPQLTRSIKEGGIKLGGVMPPFGDKLSDQDVLTLIAYFQSKWPDQVYKIWAQRHMQ
jgi:hypothetical protein